MPRACAAAVFLLILGAAGGEPAAAVDRRLGAGIAKPAAAGAPWSTAAANRLARDLDVLLDGAPTLRGAHVGLLAVDTRSGAVLYARNAADAFQPASTLKLLTGSVALARLTPDYRFRTQALLDPANATLYLHGGGDPLLRAADLDAMAQTVRAAGLAALPLGVRVDAGAFDAAPYPPGWSWDDLAYDYAPPLSAATIEENVVHLTVTAGAAPGADVAVSSAPRGARVVVAASPLGSAGAPANCTLADALVVGVVATTGQPGTADTTDVGRAPGGCLEIFGSIPAAGEPQTIDAAVPSPIWYTHVLARDALLRAGIAVGVSAPAPGLPAGSVPAGASAPRAFDAIQAPEITGSAPPGSRVVWTHDGEPLADLLADLWWPSDNLIAELLLKEIGRQATSTPGTTEHGAAVERGWLAALGLDPATVTIADGSGLSAYNRITPRALGAVLQADWNGPFRDLVLDDLPLAGVRGTLAKSFIGSPAERRTFAKTGSFNHTRGMAGYVATLHHGALTFAWLIDDWMGTDTDLNLLRGAVLSRIISD